MGLLRSILESKSGRTVANNYVALLFIQAANMLLPLAILPYLVRVLGTEKYGVVLIAQAFCTIMYVFVEFGFNLSATRRISMSKGNKEETARIFSAVLSIKGILLAITFCVYLLIVFLFNRFNIEWEVYVLSFGAVIGQALFPDWFFQGIEKMRFIAIINVIAKIIFTILIFVFILNVKDYMRVPLFNGIGYITAGVLSIIVSMRYTRFVKPSKILMKELVIESKSLFISNIAARLFNSANVFIVGMIAGDSIAGIYGSFEKIFIASKSFFSPLFQAVFPWLSNQDKLKQKESVIKLIPYIIGLAAVFTIIILIFGEQLLALLFDDDAILEYTNAFKILSIATIFAALNMLLLSLYYPASGSYKKRMNILLVGGVFNVLFALLLVSWMPIYGIVIAVATTELLLLILSWIYFRKHNE